MRAARLVTAPLIAAVVLGTAACDKPGVVRPPPTTDGGMVGGSPNKAAPGASVKLDLRGVLTLERAKL